MDYKNTPANSQAKATSATSSMENQPANHIEHHINITVENGGTNINAYGPVTFYGYNHPLQAEKKEAPMEWTEEQMAILHKAVQNGLLLEHDGGYKANMGKALLDYFLGRLLLNDQPRAKGNLLFWTATTDEDLPRNQLNAIFHAPHIGAYRSKRIKALGTVPQGHNLVDELFENK